MATIPLGFFSLKIPSGFSQKISLAVGWNWPLDEPNLPKG